MTSASRGDDVRRRGPEGSSDHDVLDPDAGDAWQVDPRLNAEHHPRLERRRRGCDAGRAARGSPARCHGRARARTARTPRRSMRSRAIASMSWPFTPTASASIGGGLRLAHGVVVATDVDRAPRRRTGCGSCPTDTRRRCTRSRAAGRCRARRSRRTDGRAAWRREDPRARSVEGEALGPVGAEERLELPRHLALGHARADPNSARWAKQASASPQARAMASTSSGGLDQPQRGELVVDGVQLDAGRGRGQRGPGGVRSATSASMPSDSIPCARGASAAGPGRSRAGRLDNVQPGASWVRLLGVARVGEESVASRVTSSVPDQPEVGLLRIGQAEAAEIALVGVLLISIASSRARRGASEGAATRASVARGGHAGRRTPVLAWAMLALCSSSVRGEVVRPVACAVRAAGDEEEDTLVERRDGHGLERARAGRGDRHRRQARDACRSGSRGAYSSSATSPPGTMELRPPVDVPQPSTGRGVPSTLASIGCPIGCASPVISPYWSVGSALSRPTVCGLSGSGGSG